LTNLQANTLYHYRVISTDASQNVATGGDSTFTTAMTAGVIVPAVVGVGGGGVSGAGGGGAGTSVKTPVSAVPALHTTPILATSTFSFTRNLAFGTTSSDVKQLQLYLNAHGFIVALTGAGSKGHETTYFGHATMTALERFQAAHNVPPTGYFGPLTRAAIQKDS